MCEITCDSWWFYDGFLQEPGGYCDTPLALPYTVDGTAEFCVSYRWPGAESTASCSLVTTAGIVTLEVAAR